MTHHQAKSTTAQQAVQQWLHKNQRQEHNTAYLSQSQSMNGLLRITAARHPQAHQYPSQLTDVDSRYRKQNAQQDQQPFATPFTAATQTITFARSNSAAVDWFRSLPFQRFQALLTLFPKSFSPFLHSTCLLSVSDRYLALDEIYHPFCAPLPRNTTRWKHAGQIIPYPKTGFSPSLTSLSRELRTGQTQGNTPQDYNSEPRKRLRFSICAIPGSFAITRGILFSFFSSAYLYA